MRIALVTNLSTHNRVPPFRLLGEALDVDYFFTGAGARRYWLTAELYRKALTGRGSRDASAAVEAQT